MKQIWNLILICCCEIWHIDSASHYRHHRQRSYETLNKYLENCGYYYSMELSDTTFTFQSPNYRQDNYFSGIDCSWSFIGSTTCTPEIFCDLLDFRRNNCGDRLIISDGVGGRVEYCDGRSPVSGLSLRATKGTRDLFVKFVTSKDSKFSKQFDGFQCTVKCADPSGSAVELDEKGVQQIEDDSCMCGIHNQFGRIVNGKNAKRNEFPWQVALVKPGTREPFCSGSIINNKYILTAAHCFWFTNVQPNQVEVLVHAHVLDFAVGSQNASVNIKFGEQGSMQGPGFDLPKASDSDEGTKRFKVSKILNHPLFTKKYDFDVSLIKVVGRIDFKGAQVAPICLPEIGDYNNHEGTVPIVSGWGMANEKSAASTRLLQKLEVPVIPFRTCQKAMPFVLTDRMMCSGYLEGQKDACMGDSGGPLSLRMKNNQWKLIGIVSWGEGCARKLRPGIYSKVTEFMQWITKNANGKGTKWCRAR